MPRRFDDEASTVGASDAGRTHRAGLSLRVFGEQLFATHTLPPSGDLTIGRSRDADVAIDDPSISRRHAMLYLGDPLRITDLGSANGTRVGGRTLSPGERAEVAVGEVVELGSVLLVVQSALAPAAPHAHEAAPEGGRAGEVVVVDGVMKQLYRLLDRMAAGTISVLLLGETGVGKEVVAEALHQRSPRAGQPLVKINCAALSETLLESELFGHEKGAFTGAVQAKPGLCETAHGGSLFLDEVGELPPPLQVKLLRVLEDRQVQRVGGLKPRRIDVRFISATNRDLAEEVEAGRFRRDLYFRLNGVSLAIPPLRERGAEIEGLARAFVARAAREAGRAAPRLTDRALGALRGHDWPGNIRELRNVIERALLMCEGDAIDLAHLALGDPGKRPAASPPAATGDERARLLGELDQLERRRIEEALAECAGNQTRAARLLGISRQTLVARIAAYDLPRPRRKS